MLDYYRIIVLKRHQIYDCEKCFSLLAILFFIASAIASAVPEVWDFPSLPFRWALTFNDSHFFFISIEKRVAKPLHQRAAKNNKRNALAKPKHTTAMNMETATAIIMATATKAATKVATMKATMTATTKTAMMTATMTATKNTATKTATNVCQFDLNIFYSNLLDKRAPKAIRRLGADKP
ncbi:23261_t:CDS:2 [Gigaspora margarita]|uniref:23261_t:CDS:1 n=1 Tax=Gigaspora margarita TaxID=4874 RepID=A0ABN7VM50_GIGMA|nr:23261_t:CDS:2 [Gigaspora margarita]